MASGSPNPCGYTTEEAAEQLLLYMKTIHRRFPEVKIGLIEPVSWYTVGNFPNHAGEYYGDLPLLLDTILPILAEGGESLEFFHADSPFDYTEELYGGQGWAKLKALQDFVQSKKMRFGLIFNSDRAGRISDELFFHETLLSKAKFAHAGGDPDDLILQSWYSHPREWLPEDEPYTYTYLLNKFLATEVPTLGLHVTTAARQEIIQVSGFVHDQVGDPIHGALIEFWLTGLDGPGIYTKYRLSGTVPVGATKAVVGFRANIECGAGAMGKPSFTLYDVSYIEDGSDTNRVPNNSFAQGLNGWGQWGTGKVTIEPSDLGTGQMLQVAGTDIQTIIVNSPVFAVTRSAYYEVIFGARVSPGSVGSGCFALIFLSPNQEVSRVTISFEPARVSYGTVTADADGAFQADFHDIPDGKVLVEATYAGDRLFLPSFAEAIIEGQPR